MLCYNIGNVVHGVVILQRDLGLRDLIAQEEKLTSKCLTFDLMSPRVIPIAPVLSVHMRGTLAAYPNSSEKNFVRATSHVAWAIAQFSASALPNLTVCCVFLRAATHAPSVITTPPLAIFRVTAHAAQFESA